MRIATLAQGWCLRAAEFAFASLEATGSVRSTGHSKVRQVCSSVKGPSLFFRPRPCPCPHPCPLCSMGTWLHPDCFPALTIGFQLTWLSQDELMSQWRSHLHIPGAPVHRVGQVCEPPLCLPHTGTQVWNFSRDQCQILFVALLTLYFHKKT